MAVQDSNNYYRVGQNNNMSKIYIDVMEGGSITSNSVKSVSGFNNGWKKVTIDWTDSSTIKATFSDSPAGGSTSASVSHSTTPFSSGGLGFTTTGGGDTPFDLVKEL